MQKMQSATPANEVAVSVASIWEVVIKHSRGRLTLTKAPEDFFEEHVEKNLFSILSISPLHAFAVGRLAQRSDHRDPFDRLLVAQCLVEQMTLVSGDTRLDTYGVQRVW
jgi:PIN domain nuclease of toxin-antitoxin system